MKNFAMLIGIALCLASSTSVSAQWKRTDISLITGKDTVCFQSNFLVDEFTPECEIVVKKCSPSEHKESYYQMSDAGETNYEWGGLKSQRTAYKVATVKKENADVITEFRYPTFTSPWTIRWDIIVSWVLLFVFGILIIKKQKTTQQKIKIVVGIVIGVIVGIVSIFMALKVTSNFDIYLNFIGCIVGLTLLLLLFFLGATFKSVFGPYSIVFVAYISFGMAWLIGMGINTGQWLPTLIGIVCFCVGILCKRFYNSTKNTTITITEQNEE